MAKKRELTKLMAFWLTHRLWVWMAETGSESETFWPEWRMWERIYKEGFTIKYSPLCKYYLDKQDSFISQEAKRKHACHECAEECDDIWRVQSGESSLCCMESEDSIYYEWMLAPDDEELRKEYAREMADKFYEMYLQFGGKSRECVFSPEMSED